MDVEADSGLDAIVNQDFGDLASQTDNGLDQKMHEECGVFLVKLKKPIEEYSENYLLDKARTMLMKQRHRGQQGMGLSIVVTDEKTDDYKMYTYKTTGNIDDLFRKIENDINKGINLKGNLIIGHNWYTTFGNPDVINAHPFETGHGRPSKHLSVASNSNFINNAEHIERLKNIGYSPTTQGDIERIANDIGFQTSQEHTKLLKKKGIKKISDIIKKGLNPFKIFEGIDFSKIFKRASKNWKGAYNVVVAYRNGSGFAASDPKKIRPLCMHQDDEVIAVASETRPITAAFKDRKLNIEEIKPGHIVQIRPDGNVEYGPYTKDIGERCNCIFEHIYFARLTSHVFGRESNAKIRIKAGEYLARTVYEKLEGDGNKKTDDKSNNRSEIDWNNVVITGSPNSARPYGQGFARELRKLTGIGSIDYDDVLDKDDFVRTFIAASPEERKNLVLTKFDVVGDMIKGKDIIICEDSIVRSNTIKNVLVPILKWAGAKSVHLAVGYSPVKYPCFYAIDMSTFGEFGYYNAVLGLMADKERQKDYRNFVKECESAVNNGSKDNLASKLYNMFPVNEVEAKLADISGADSITYQKYEDLPKIIGSKKLCMACTDGCHPYEEGMILQNKALLKALKKMDGDGERTY